MRRAMLMLAACACLSACGSPSAPPPPEAERAAMEQAVAAYLAKQNMELKIDAWKSYAPAADGRSARAELAMTHAGGMVSASARFVFTFEKSSDGSWRVTGHEQK